MTGSLTATCTTRAPIAIQATAKWVERKLNSQGYHCAEFISPVVSWKIDGGDEHGDRQPLERGEQQLRARHDRSEAKRRG